MLTIDEARYALKEGKIIVYPTDTVWGIGCNPFQQESVNTLFTVKGKKENGVSILVNNIDLISEYCVTSAKQKNLIEKLFPGPVTGLPRLPLSKSASTASWSIRFSLFTMIAGAPKSKSLLSRLFLFITLR